MENINSNVVENEELKYPFFTTRDGEVPFWDHPFLKSVKMIPKKYYPYTTLESVLDLYRRGILDEIDLTILKVLGDAVCANENQLRRYMSPITSASDTSKRLDRFRRNALVERWKVRVRGDEDGYKPPAPFTLGIAGYKLLKHFYNGEFFLNPNLWDKYGVGGIKRYVSMNEIRCTMAEMKIVKKWKWNAVVANNPQLKFPMGAAEIQTGNGKINFLIDRAQMNQNFIGYFRDKLETWQKVYENFGNIPISEFDENPSFVVIYTSTLSIAEYIHQNLILDSYPFNILLCVEELMQKDGFEKAFLRPKGEKLQRIQLHF